VSEWPKDTVYGFRYESIYEHAFDLFEEAPSSLNRSDGHEGIVEDKQTIETGETVSTFNENIIGKYDRTRATLVRPDGSTKDLGILDVHTSFTPQQAGEFVVRGPEGVIQRIDVVSGNGDVGDETIGDPGDFTNVEPADDEPDLAERPGFVNADNELGARVAPAVRDEVDMTVDDLVGGSGDVEGFADRVESAASTTASTTTSSTSTSSTPSPPAPPALASLAPLVVAAVALGWWLL
jgi:hypothetical protein